MPKRKEKLKVIIFRSKVYRLSGVETFVYNLCQQIGNAYDITLLYMSGDYAQLKRISEYADIEKYDINKEYACDVLIENYIDMFVPNIKAGKIIGVVHSDYRYSNPIKFNSVSDKSDMVVCVSEEVAKSFYEISGKESVVIPNILSEKVQAKRILRLVSFTRITKEKGYERMCILAKLLKDNNIKFDWKIFCEDTGQEKMKYLEVTHYPVTNDVADYLEDADYLVQLSDSESFCYSVHEALQYGVPVIVTDLEVFKGIVEDGLNGYKLPLDMKDIDIHNIYNNIPFDFCYKPDTDSIKSQWYKVIGSPVKSAKKRKNTLKDDVLVEVIRTYHDREQNVYKKAGERFYTNKIRADELSSETNNASLPVVKIVEDK